MAGTSRTYYRLGRVPDFNGKIALSKISNRTMSKQFDIKNNYFQRFLIDIGGFIVYPKEQETR